MLAAIKALVGPDRYSVLLPLNEFEPLLVLALQQPRSCCATTAAGAISAAPDFRRALEFYASMFERDWAPRMTNTQISNVWDEFGKRHLLLLHLRAVEHRRVQAPSAADLQDAWMTAPMPGPDGPGVSERRWREPGDLPSLATARRQPGQLDEYLSRPAVQQRFYELTGDMPPRRSTWQSPALAASPYARAFLTQLDRVRSPPKVPEWERIATEMRLACRARRATARPPSMMPSSRSIARPTRFSRSAAG